jgi:radical SAM superfamily enzyme
MRFGCEPDYALMKKAKFRMLLYGLESINQTTLDRLNKGIKADEVERELREASRQGLEPHVAFLLGVPWESEEEEMRTIRFVRRMLRKGYTKTAQCSLYDVQGEEAVDRHRRTEIYKVAISPEFWFNQIRTIRRWEDAIYLLRGIKEGLRNV